VKRFLAVTAVLCLAACAKSAGEASGGFISPTLANAYLPLEGSAGMFRDAAGAAMVIAPGIAVTNAHNANIVDGASVIGQSRDYDLLFFRTGRTAVPATAEPSVGEAVIAYGEGIDSDLREARGIVRSLSSPVLARCLDCPVQQVFTFEAKAGGGFSGGPVADVATGRLVGIVFGYNDQNDGSRLMYAYDMSRVAAELERIRKKPAQTAAQPR
jgi:hypothetical protein